MQTAALTWLAYRLTAGSSLPARVTAAQVVPTLLLGVWGGGLADRLPRRSLIFLAQAGLLLLALLLAGMVAFGLATPLALLAASLLIGVVNAIDTPARLAFVIDMVGRDDLMNAVALNSLLFNVARAVGPALGMLALPWVGLAGCFLLNGLTFLAVLAALAAMRLPRPGRRAGRAKRGSLASGFRHLARRRGCSCCWPSPGPWPFSAGRSSRCSPRWPTSRCGGLGRLRLDAQRASASAPCSAPWSSPRSARRPAGRADRPGRGRRVGLPRRAGPLPDAAPASACSRRRGAA